MFSWRPRMCVSPLVVSDSLQPHGLQPSRLLCPWNSPGKSTGVVIFSFTGDLGQWTIFKCASGSWPERLSGLLRKGSLAVKNAGDLQRLRLDCAGRVWEGDWESQDCLLVSKCRTAAESRRVGLMFRGACPPARGFLGSSVGKETACSAGDMGSIPGSGRFPGEGNGNSL